MLDSLDPLVERIISIYSRLEYALIIEIAKRFDVYDSIGGSLEWQIKKLEELGALNADAVKLIAQFSKRSEKEIIIMLNEAKFINIDFDLLTKAFDAGAIKISPLTLMENTAFTRLIESTYKELGDTFRLIQTKALESTKQAYMDVINRSYVEVATGTYDYGTSIKRAVNRMAQQGITAATYKRGERIINYSIEGAVRRDTLSAVNKLANASALQAVNELGAEYVETSMHIGARVHPTNPIANHAGWQGKVFKVNGSDKYPNLKESTGYPDDILGLGGVNCRHRIFPFFPGISVPKRKTFTDEENKKAYELSQKQRALERQMRTLKKRHAAAKAIGDKETAQALKKKITANSDEIDKFCKDNNLRRDYSRELVFEQMK